MSKQEKIVCAAVEFETNSGKNIIICLRYEGDPRVENHRFHLADYGLNEDENYNEILGFITNKGRFVDPKEAMKIAVKAGQVKNDFMLMSDPPQYRNLKPEDLY